MLSSEVLNQAADHIERYGHRKKALGSEGQPTCALGAIQVASGEVVPPAALAFYRYIGRSSVADWNNAPERTGAEVVEAFRACALIEAAKENAETRESVSA